MKVKVTYGDGSQETVDKSDCYDIAMVANSIFGRELGPFEAIEAVIEDMTPDLAPVDSKVPPLPADIPAHLTEAEILALATTPPDPVAPVVTPVVKGKKAKAVPAVDPAPAPAAAPWE